MCSKPSTETSFTAGFIAECQARRGEKNDQICLLEGLGLGIFKNEVWMSQGT